MRYHSNQCVVTIAKKTAIASATTRVISAGTEIRRFIGTSDFRPTRTPASGGASQHLRTHFS
jgi:hypothetical protein